MECERRKGGGGGEVRGRVTSVGEVMEEEEEASGVESRQKEGKR